MSEGHRPYGDGPSLFLLSLRHDDHDEGQGTTGRHSESYKTDLHLLSTPRRPAAPRVAPICGRLDRGLVPPPRPLKGIPLLGRGRRIVSEAMQPVNGSWRRALVLCADIGKSMLAGRGPLSTLEKVAWRSHRCLCSPSPGSDLAGAKSVGCVMGLLERLAVQER